MSFASNNKNKQIGFTIPSIIHANPPIADTTTNTVFTFKNALQIQRIKNSNNTICVHVVAINVKMKYFEVTSNNTFCP